MGSLASQSPLTVPCVLLDPSLRCRGVASPALSIVYGKSLLYYYFIIGDQGQVEKREEEKDRSKWAKVYCGQYWRIVFVRHEANGAKSGHTTTGEQTSGGGGRAWLAWTLALTPPGRSVTIFFNATFLPKSICYLK